MTKPARIRVRTAQGDAVYAIPAGRSGSLCGLEIDAELLDGATLTTDPARLSDHLPWVHAAPDWGAQGCGGGAGGVRRGADGVRG